MSYTGWLLPEDERTKLLAMFPPVYPDVIALHVTEELRNAPLPKGTEGEIIGEVDDGKGCQALVVEINGTRHRRLGGTYHITWSIDRAAGRKPVDSNVVLNTLGFAPFTETVKIKLVPTLFK